MKTPIFLTLFVMAGLITAQGQTAAQQADQAMNDLIKELNAVGLSVAVVKDNAIVYTGAFGAKNLEKGTQISTDDIFRIASISKSFTATAMMQLFEQGRFDLDDDVSPALGFLVRNPNHKDIPITYRMLLTHTSSLNDTTGYFSLDVIDPQKTQEYWRAYNQYAPGTDYEYCNLGFNMLGTLVEIHSGERYDRYIHNHIIEPLGLHAGFNVDAFDRSEFVTIYEYENGEFVASPDAYRSRATELQNYTMGRTTPIFSPTGGMKIAPKDLAKHLLVQINQGTLNGVQILKPESVKAMQTPYDYPDKRASGYGFAITTSTRLIEGETLKGHTGSAYGLYSAMFFEPEKKFGFVMMTNGYPAKYENGFLTIQYRVINALYEIFIKE
ncbi:MAG: beta-lactamase family protein [Prevotellaceae bacterium]|jgi:CubicO group peptidase (beta-lactamase class C family)|nr:beta-lactamase family protein [Prevotellaceae bacterium]